MGLELWLLSRLEPGQQRRGIEASFEQARAAFEAAWRQMLPTLTEAAFDEWRDAVASRAEIRRLHERGEKLPSEIPSSMMRCPCGVVFDSHDPEESLPHRAHIYAIQAKGGIIR
ncbi:hypothetical protein I6F35_22470 [Bradyrhizobium sp. BRP22]|uniref:hypothetical protein n=1 Tax=Bradyrhizobium sp. BRP22 TaxID=2793821 RepID=UPI001CD4A0BE|nr:hypothetical protein [Bradyrhizobium sp. BRP22]MCA1455935.1 hypothetical protein [Bradyrhizobium sp. BRP22]